MVLRDQALALRRLAELVDAELWREDRRTVALSVLRGLVCGMAWDTGLVAGVTRAHLATAAGCSTRTVSRVVAWAMEAGLLVCVEAGATAEFLGATSNRAPSYVLTAPPGFGAGDNLSVPPKPAQSPGDELGNPPAYGGQQTSPRRERGLNPRHDQKPHEPWLLAGVCRHHNDWEDGCWHRLAKLSAEIMPCSAHRTQVTPDRTCLGIPRTAHSSHSQKSMYI